MYKSISEIKKEARVAISGRKGIYILMWSLTAAIASVCSASGFLSIAASLLSILFQVGMTFFMLKVCCGQKEQAQFNDLFYIFNTQDGQVGKAFLLYLLEALYLLPAVIIYVVLMFVYAFGGVKAIGGADAVGIALSSLSFLAFALIAFAAFFIYSLYIAMTYSMTFYILLDYPQLSTKQIWKRANQILKGNRLRYIGLELSYLVWYLIPVAFMVLAILLYPYSLLALPNLTLSILILLSAALFIAFALWIGPNMACAQAVFYLDLMKRHSRPVEPETI